jgi:hypothetical protein
MTLIELISKFNINLFIKLKNNYEKVMPLLDKEYIVIDISSEKQCKKEEEDEEVDEDNEDDEFIDLELGNGFKLINEEKTMYFYNKV